MRSFSSNSICIALVLASVVQAGAQARLEILGDLPGGQNNSTAYTISADGQEVFGIGTTALGRERFRWTRETGMVSLGAGTDPDPGSLLFFGTGKKTSADGKTFVGTEFPGPSGVYPQAFISSNGRTDFIGVSEPGLIINDSAAFAVSPDGEVVIGRGGTALSVPDRPFVWTRGRGVQTLLDVLFSYDVPLVLETTAYDIGLSGNDLFIVGQSKFFLAPRGLPADFAYRVTLPIVSASLANSVVNLLEQDSLTLDVSATKLLYGEVETYEFDFTSDGIYDLTIDATSMLNGRTTLSADSPFVLQGPELIGFFPGIDSPSFDRLDFTTTVRMTHSNGTAFDIDTATITFVPEASSLSLVATVVLLGVGFRWIYSYRRANG